MVSNPVPCHISMVVHSSALALWTPDARHTYTGLVIKPGTERNEMERNETKRNGKDRRKCVL